MENLLIWKVRDILNILSADVLKEQSLDSTANFMVSGLGQEYQFSEKTWI